MAGPDASQTALPPISPPLLCILQDFDAEEAEALEDEHEAENELLDAGEQVGILLLLTCFASARLHYLLSAMALVQ